MSDQPEAKKIKLDSSEESVNSTVAFNNSKNHHNVVKAHIQCEKDVGITEYINDYPPIFGILKQRFSDFVVHEICKENEVIKLTNIDLPPEKKFECDKSVLDDSTIDKLEALNNDKSCGNVEIPIDNVDKTERKAIHCAIKSLFPKLDSNTVDKDGLKIIKVCLKANRTNFRNDWPSNFGKFVHFVLYKENKDTMEAINILASKLRVNPSIFGYAGTKDRRAKTSQLVSVKQVLPVKLLALNKSLHQMRIGNITFKPVPLKLGDLNGNHFTVILREICSSQEIIDSAMKSLQDKGFINYFGMQRFGTSNVPTQHIGRALLKSDWKEAIDLILKPRTGDDPHFGQCRKIWHETKDPEKALQQLPRFRRSSIEGQLLVGISTHRQNDLVNALNSIPRNIRLMYVHSYQSYVWNTAVSYRIKQHGLDPVVGDLVLVDNSADLKLDDNKHGKSDEQVITLSEEDVSEKKYTIYDVVLPLPGYDVKYPENEVKNVFKKLLESDGLDMDNMKMKVKDYSLSGSYRKIMIQPKNLSWSLHFYDDATKVLELSDLEELENVTRPPNLEDGKYQALKINLSLPSSSYATMALREIMKMDTSSNFQKTLNSSSGD